MEALAACHDADSKLVMYFMVNAASVSYLDSLDNFTDTLKAPILWNRTTYEQTSPISLSPPAFDSRLTTVAKTLKDYVHQIWQKRESFDLQERHTIMELESPSKNFFFNNYVLNVFLFVTAKISLLVMILVILILCKIWNLKL